MAKEEPRWYFPPDVRPKADQFVRKSWEVLAAAAWRLYQRAGRGGVVIPWSIVEDFVAGRRVQIDARPLKRTDVPQLAAAIAGYDPKTEVLSVFMSPRDFISLENGGPIIDAVYFQTDRMAPPPPQAHANRAD